MLMNVFLLEKISEVGIFEELWEEEFEDCEYEIM